jgi:hypothetical protein
MTVPPSKLINWGVDDLRLAGALFQSQPRVYWLVMIKGNGVADGVIRLQRLQSVGGIAVVPGAT